MFSVSDLLKRSSDKLGLRRVVFDEGKVPTSIDNVVIFPFFGDNRSSFIMSSLLLRRMKEEAKSSKYFILLSWPGYESLFPFVDEYWTVENSASLEKLISGAVGFSNESSYYTLLIRGLNEWFYEILKYSDFSAYYENGFKKEFFEKFKHIKVNLPNINSSSYLGLDFVRYINNKELKVFIYPCKEIRTFKFGKHHKEKINKNFWIKLTNRLVAEGYCPIIYRDIFCHDISVEVNKNCVHFYEQDLSKMLTAMRSCGIVIDVFNGISNLAICARSNFLCLEERSNFNALKQYEIDDLCGKGLIKEYIFSFNTIINDNNEQQWESIYFDAIISKLNKLFVNMNRDLPSSVESNEIVPYDVVRKIKNKKFGSRFIKIKKD